MSAQRPSPSRRSAVPVNRLAADLRLVVTRMARRLRQHAGGGRSPSQLAMLATIERRGPMTLGELAAAEQVQPPTVTSVVARLEEGGLVVRTTHERDRRVSVVAVTPAGVGYLRESRRAKEAFLARKLAAMSDEDRAALARSTVLLEDMLAEPQEDS